MIADWITYGGAGWLALSVLIVVAMCWWTAREEARDTEADWTRRRAEREASYRTNRGRVLRMDEARAQARCRPLGNVDVINEGEPK